MATKYPLKKGFISIKDKAQKNWSKYYSKCYLLKTEIVSIEEEEAGYLRGYTLEGNGEVWKGKTQFELIEDLKKLKARYNLETYETTVNVEGKVLYQNKEILLIYIDNLMKVSGFLKDIITYKDTNIIQVLDNIEFREYGDWSVKGDIKELQEVVDKIFIPEKYFYFTPNQKTRKNLAKECDSKISDELYPKKFRDFQFLRKALFGGICYCPYPGLTVDDPMIGLDIVSAYIYTMLTRKFPVKKIEAVDTENYEYYLNNEFKSSLGIYEIEYSTSSSIVKCYKDEDGNVFEKGHQKVTCVFNNIDLNVFLNLPNVYVHNVKCIYLEAYEMEYLPKYVANKLVQEFIAKSLIDEDLNPNLYKLQKTILNGIYGNTIKKADDEESYYLLKSTNKLAPQWGIWTTSYTKELLVGLAKKLNGWMYSDTDSIYCLDTEENRSIVKAYNDKIRKSVAKMCEANKLLFADLQDLGQFETKHNKIIKFRALKRKEYLFTEIKYDKKLKKDIEVINIKAAGCNKEELKNLSNEEKNNLYKVKKLPVGTRIFPKINKNKTTTIIDGEEVTSNGSYWEKTCSGEEAELELAIQAAKYEDAYN